jgi:uncharacterized membrane protein
MIGVNALYHRVHGPPPPGVTSPIASAYIHRRVDAGQWRDAGRSTAADAAQHKPGRISTGRTGARPAVGMPGTKGVDSGIHFGDALVCGRRPSGGGIMNIRAVEAGRGAGWIGAGWDYFTRSAGIWVAITIVWFVIFVALGFVPFIGGFVSQLLTPVFAAGLFLGCRAMDEGGTLELGHLFRGFSVNTGPLILVGALYLAAVIALFIVLALFAFALLGGIGVVIQAMQGQPEELIGNLPMLAVVLLLGLALYVPILMALWFAPALVALGGLAVGDAVNASFRGCLRNIVPFLLWGLIMLLLGILAAIPFGLGFLVLFPLIWASTYAAYKEIFAP